MAVTLFNKPRTFNTRTVEVALGRNGKKVQWAGFENLGLGRVAPFAEASRIIARDGVANTTDPAARGDIRITTAVALTAPQRAAINTTLDDHDDTVDDAGQLKLRTAEQEVAALKVTHDGGIADPIVARLARIALTEAGVDV